MVQKPASKPQRPPRPPAVCKPATWPFQAPTDLNAGWPWLGGLSPTRFMQRHWQKKPLLVRQAWATGTATLPATRTALFTLAARDDVMSRLVQGRSVGAPDGWQLHTGPIPRRRLPRLADPGWTLLVQGVDRHLPAARRWLEPFRFIPDVRLDDLMISYASDAGGVGPHVDSYDVFLLQLHGRRRWRVAPNTRPQWVPGLPLKILQRFEPTHEWLLEPGDLLYVPPGWAHDGVADGECMTASVGFRAPATDAFAVEMLQRMLDAHEPPERDPLYRDPLQPPTLTPAAMPSALQQHAEAAVSEWLADPAALRHAVQLALGEWASEPHQDAWFPADAAPMAAPVADSAVRLDRRSRMLYDEQNVYLNGEAYAVRGRDATLLRRLADRRSLSASDSARLSPTASAALGEWVRHGWLIGAVDESVD